MLDSAKNRVIRVFVSSTFADMQAERDELIKRVFPQLRKRCEQRGVVWGEVDLRWGITDEQKAEHQVLPICLAEIDNTRPYFIGLLGERYGWIPDDIDSELIDRQPWLAEQRDRSVTELEILYGVLNNPAMANHAFFYFRSSSFLAGMPPRQRRPYVEMPTRDELTRYGWAARRRVKDRQVKLAGLKDRIRASGLPVREDYRDARELGTLVLQDLTRVIDTLYPEGSALDPLDREALEHEAFATSRARVYIGRPTDDARLDAHAAGDGPPLVVLGQSGLGKSALLANWALRYRARRPEPPRPVKTSLLGRLLGRARTVATQDTAPIPVLVHFVGATPYSADWAAMLRRIIGELNRLFHLSVELPSEPDAARQAFANCLHLAARKGRFILILDGLNQLEDRDAAPDLVWLPPVIPPNVRLILSTLPGRAKDELARRGWPTLRVAPLAVDERKQLITSYLAQHTKALSPSAIEWIAAAPQTANPLYLRALLDELLVYGDHLTLDRRIDHYLEAETIPALYEKILERYEQDYERDRPGLVGDAMRALWAARRGLSQAELLNLLGGGAAPLPAAYWSPLFLVAEQSLVSRSGLIGFFHDYLRQAVRDRYLPTDSEQRAAHERLAAYFADRDLGPRKIDELPWQLAQANAWRQLYDLLADGPFFDAAWNADQFGVKAFWARVESESPLRLADAYRSTVLAPGPHSSDHLWALARLEADAGHPDEALSLRENLARRFRESGDRANLSASLGGQARIHLDRGELDRAMALHQEEEQICRELGDRRGLSASLEGQALIHRARGELDRAMALLQEQEQICRELGDKAGLQASLGNQALIHLDRGELDRAMALQQQEEQICRELGEPRGLAVCLVNQALLLTARHRQPEVARALAEEAQRLVERHGLTALAHKIGPVLEYVRSNTR